MIGRIEVWVSLLALPMILMAEPAEGNGTAQCAGVVLLPSASQPHPATLETLREVQGVLLERVVAAHEAEGLDNSLFVSLDRDRFVLDAPGMTCEEATSLARSRIARLTTVDIGLSGSVPRFHVDDLEPRVEVVDGEVRLRLRPEAKEKFRSLTRENVGGSVVVRINDSAAIELPIRTEQVSGVIVLDRSEVPEGSFVAETVLPLRLDVDGCGSCLGEYR
jgi:hypothetical protein